MKKLLAALVVSATVLFAGGMNYEGKYKCTEETDKSIYYIFEKYPNFIVDTSDGAVYQKFNESVNKYDQPYISYKYKRVLLQDFISPKNEYLVNVFVYDENYKLTKLIKFDCLQYN